MVKVYIGSDHAGFKLKEKIKKFLDKKRVSYSDMGPFSYKKEDDYPDYILPVAYKVSKNKNSKGIVIGYSGQGEAITANKVKGIRAIVYYGKEKKIIPLSREHNDANVLSLGAGFVKEKEAVKIIDLWLKTKFSREARHNRRIEKIKKYENKRK